MDRRELLALAGLGLFCCEAAEARMKAGPVVMSNHVRERVVGGALILTQWNPADQSGVTLSGGNLTAQATVGAGFVRSIAKKLAGTGKIYWEVKVATWANGNSLHGFCPGSVVTPSGASPTGLCGLYNSGNIWLNNANTGSTLGLRASNDFIGIALDATAKLAWFRVAPVGNWNGSGAADPATGVGGINVASILSVDAYAVAAFGGAAEAVIGDFGGSAFVGTVPSGYAIGFN